jgi:AcrR family transcriptional regulator
MGIADRQVLDGARKAVATWGVSRLSLDDVARAAGCSRATVYRAVPGGKDGVLAALVADARAELTSLVLSASAEHDNLEDALTAALVAMGRFVASFAPLRFVCDHEPEALIPYTGFRGADPVLFAMADVAATVIAPYVDPADLDRSAEWLARVALSHVLDPSPFLDLTDPDSVRDLVAIFLAPGLTNSACPPSPKGSS